MANEFEVRNGIISLGGVTFPLTKIGNTYSILETDNFIEVTGGTFNVTLPNSIGVKGKFFQTLYFLRSNNFSVYNLLIR